MFHFKTLFFRQQSHYIAAQTRLSLYTNTLYKQHIPPKPFRNITIRNYTK